MKKEMLESDQIKGKQMIKKFNLRLTFCFLKRFLLMLRAMPSLIALRN